MNTDKQHGITYDMIVDMVETLNKSEMMMKMMHSESLSLIEKTIELLSYHMYNSDDTNTIV